MTSEMIVQFLGAFAGATFTFLFIRLAEALNKIYEREVKNYNALVKLQLVLNFNLNAIFLNRRNIGRFRDVLNKTKETKIITINPTKFESLMLLDEFISELYYPDLINELFHFNIGLYKTNQDTSVPNETYLSFADQCCQRNDFNTYLHNLSLLVDNMSDLESYFKHLDQETIMLVAKLRVLARKKPLFIRIMFKVISTKLPKNLAKEVENEKSVVEKEIKEITTESQKEKRRIFER